MNRFNFKKRNLVSGLHLLGPVLIIAGLFALLSPLFMESGSSMEKIIGVGVGAIVIGLGIVSSFSGTLIDFNEKRFKEYFSIVGYKFGEWADLPDISTVKVISNSYVITNTPNGISPTFSGKVTDFRTFLYSDASKPVFSFVYSNKNKAIKKAKKLASNLDAELVINIE
ncbi:hypothetical protein [Aquiflexum sp.]|uniref:hypothetical protein n=1 Tax=Aquiflexum sp. TaxID=1872584 RepID=UPI003592ECA7